MADPRRVSTAGVYIADATPVRRTSTLGVYVVHGPNQRRVSTAGVYVVTPDEPANKPHTPTLSITAVGATWADLAISAFAHPDPARVCAATQVRVSRDAAGTDVMYDKTSAADLTATRAEPLPGATALYALARKQDDLGQWSDWSDAVAFTTLAPVVAAFTFTRTGKTVRFTDASTGPVTSWLWAFGDGATSTDQHPEHTYGTDGRYTVTLTVGSAEGATSSHSAVVGIAGPQSFHEGFCRLAEGERIKEGGRYVEWVRYGATSSFVARNRRGLRVLAREREAPSATAVDPVSPAAVSYYATDQACRVAGYINNVAGYTLGAVARGQDVADLANVPTGTGRDIALYAAVLRDGTALELFYTGGLASGGSLLDAREVLGSAAVAHDTVREWVVEIQAEGAALRARAWVEGEPVPAWQIETTDTRITYGAPALIAIGYGDVEFSSISIGIEGAPIGEPDDITDPVLEVIEAAPGHLIVDGGPFVPIAGEEHGATRVRLYTEGGVLVRDTDWQASPLRNVRVDGLPHAYVYMAEIGYRTWCGDEAWSERVRVEADGRFGGWLIIDGLRVPVAIDDQATVDHEDVGGEIRRAYDTAAHQSARGSARVWAVRTTPMQAVDADALLAKLFSAFDPLCWGTLIGGTVACTARAIRAHFVATADGPRRVVAFELHEVIPRAL